MEGPGESGQRPQESEANKETFHFRFESNETLLDLSSYIASTEPNWERMIQTYQAVNRRGAKFDENNVPGELLEIHLRMLLHDFSRETGKLDVDPIADGYRTKNIFFEKHPGTGGMSIVNLPSLTHHSEKDALFRADDLLTVAEVKYTKIRNEAYRRKSKRSALSDAIRPEATNWELQPYVDAFGLPLGYIVVTMPEAVSEESLLQQDFLANGGIIVPFKTTYDEFGFRAFQAFHNRLQRD